MTHTFKNWVYDQLFLGPIYSDLIGTNFVRVRVMVINSTFNNISVILWQKVLLVVKTAVPKENHQP
jgi:hypothetical protein